MKSNITKTHGQQHIKPPQTVFGNKDIFYLLRYVNQYNARICREQQSAGSDGRYNLFKKNQEVWYFVSPAQAMT